MSGKKFIFIVVQRDLRGIRKLWSLLCSWWWISLCLQSLLQPQTPGKMRRWNVSPHVVKSNTSHNGTLEDSHLGLKTTQRSRTGENTCHIGLSTQTHRLRGQLRIDILHTSLNTQKTTDLLIIQTQADNKQLQPDLVYHRDKYLHFASNSSSQAPALSFSSDMSRCCCCRLLCC